MHLPCGGTRNSRPHPWRGYGVRPAGGVLRSPVPGGCTPRGLQASVPGTFPPTAYGGVCTPSVRSARRGSETAPPKPRCYGCAVRRSAPIHPLRGSRSCLAGRDESLTPLGRRERWVPFPTPLCLPMPATWAGGDRGSAYLSQRPVLRPLAGWVRHDAAEGLRYRPSCLPPREGSRRIPQEGADKRGPGVRRERMANGCMAGTWCYPRWGLLTPFPCQALSLGASLPPGQGCFPACPSSLRRGTDQPGAQGRLPSAWGRRAALG